MQRKREESDQVSIPLSEERYHKLRLAYLTGLIARYGSCKFKDDGSLHLSTLMEPMKWHYKNGAFTMYRSYWETLQKTGNLDWGVLRFRKTKKGFTVYTKVMNIMTEGVK